MIVLFAGLILNAIFITVIPITLNFNGTSDSIKIWEIKTMSELSMVCTVSLFCSVIGEIVANPNDRIFILSRPVRRSIYLTAKLMLTTTFAIFFAIVITACYLILEKWCNSKNVVLYSGKMKFEYMILLTFILCIFGGITGTSLRYYSREMIVSIIVFVVVFSYGVGFSFAVTQKPEKTPDFEYMESFFIPLTVILPICAGVLGIGYFLNQRINIGV